MTDGGSATAWRHAIFIALFGIAIGVFYNHLGLQAETWGVAWVGEEKSIEDLPTIGLEPADGEPPTDGEPGADETGGDDFPVFEGDDPMGMLGGGTAESASATEPLPEIPELGRPLQIQLPAVKRFFDADGALIIDAREPDEFAEGRIRGSINLPYDQAVTDPVLLESLDTGGRPLIVYCGGGTCELSLNLAYSLVEAGHTRVCVFMGGYPEWVDAGYPIATGGEG